LLPLASPVYRWRLLCDLSPIHSNCPGPSNSLGSTRVDAIVAD
jgi:hypothetical protein